MISDAQGWVEDQVDAPAVYGGWGSCRCCCGVWLSQLQEQEVGVSQRRTRGYTRGPLRSDHSRRRFSECLAGRSRQLYRPPACAALSEASVRISRGPRRNGATEPEPVRCCICRCHSDQRLQIAMELEKENRTFFELVRQHTMEGYYGAPRHGGNRDAASWRMLGLDEPPLRGRAQYDLRKGSDA